MIFTNMDCIKADAMPPPAGFILSNAKSICTSDNDCFGIMGTNCAGDDAETAMESFGISFGRCRANSVLGASPSKKPNCVGQKIDISGW